MAAPSTDKKIEVYDPGSRVWVSQHFLDEAAEDFEAVFGTRDVRGLLESQIWRSLSRGTDERTH